MKARSDILHIQISKSILQMRNGENWILSAYLQEKETATSSSLLAEGRKTFALWILDEKDPEISL